MAAFLLVAYSGFGQNQTPPNPENWQKVYLNSGRSIWIPKGWSTEEKTLDNGTIQFISSNPARQMWLTMWFYNTERSAGDRMEGMISTNNIDVTKSYTETYGALKVMSKIGKMVTNGKQNNVIISTAEGAGGNWNVVGAYWSDPERFGKHKNKFPIFFNSLN